MIRQCPRATPEVSAENDQVDVQAIQSLRKALRSRSDLLRLTVNDLLILYRAIHAVTYQPDPTLLAELKRHVRAAPKQQAFRVALEAVSQKTHASILIPVDASLRSPRDRLYPMTFEVPLDELDLLSLHGQVLDALSAYNHGQEDRDALYERFDQLQRQYLATLAGFGAVLNKAKEIAISGESASVGVIKLLAHMPTPLQRLLDQIPGRFETLNDLIKGREVFSNVGAVAPTSTLLRFTTAKDDNDQKTLVWGVLTDAAGIMHISLRDFRPHVGLLEQIGQRELAVRIGQDYLNAYVRGFNAFISDLHWITLASRESRPKLEETP